MSTGGKPKNPNGAWVLMLDFASHGDAETAKQMIREAFGDLFGEFTLRPKRQHPSHGNIAQWRSTALVREALSNRTFGREEVEHVLTSNGYLSSDYRSWLTSACKFGAIERVSKGVYRFPAPKAASPANEEISCEAP